MTTNLVVGDVDATVVDPPAQQWVEAISRPAPLDPERILAIMRKEASRVERLRVD